MQQLLPIQTAEREKFMDCLRGFAILGILIANMNGFSWYSERAGLTGPYLLPKADHTMSFLHHLFIEGKFYSIFSLLFGWGIALQVKRGIASGSPYMPTIRRRLAFMLLLGFLHLMLWPGDIVFFYAMLGFVLLPLRKFSNKTLLITGTILVLSPILLYWLKMTWPVLNYPSEQMSRWAMQTGASVSNVHSEEEFFNLLRKGNWWEQLKMNVSGAFFRYNYLFFVSRVPKVLGMFLIGYVIGRSDFYKNLGQNKKAVYWIIGLGFAIGLPANYMLADYMSNGHGEYWQLKTKGLYETIAYALGVAPLALAYTGMLMLAFQSTIGKNILSVFAPVGKMAFSNYILHSLIGSFIFLGAGLGYMGKVGPVYYTLLALIIFAAQVILSAVWLRFFNYGPVEWLWRSATYKKWQRLRKR